MKRWEESQSAVGLREREKGAEDVKWNRKGEQREWDAGKVVLGGAEGDEMDPSFRAAAATTGAKGRRDLYGGKFGIWQQTNTLLQNNHVSSTIVLENSLVCTNHYY